MKNAILFAVAALVVPSVALAQGPPSGKGPGSHGKSNPKVMYVLKGTLSAYTAANGSINGTITIMVTKANRHGWALKGQSLTFPVTSSSKVELQNGLTTITDGDLGIVKVKALKRIDPAALATTLEASNAFQIIDHGPASSG